MTGLGLALMAGAAVVLGLGAACAWSLWLLPAPTLLWVAGLLLVIGRRP